MFITFRQFHEFCQHLEACGLGNPYVIPDQKCYVLYIHDHARVVRYGATSDTGFRQFIMFEFTDDSVTISSLAQDVDSETYPLSELFSAPRDSKHELWYDVFLPSQHRMLDMSRIVKPYAQKKIYDEQDASWVIRPKFMTFGDFFNFCAAVKWKCPDAPIYQPYHTAAKCLKIYEDQPKVEYGRMIGDIFIPKVSFTMAAGLVRVVREDHESSPDTGLFYDICSDPFCFGTEEHVVDWYRAARLTLSEYRWFRDMLAHFQNGHSVGHWNI